MKRLIEQENIREQKQFLRRKIVQILSRISKEELKRRSKDVCGKIKSLPVYKKAKTIAGYYPLAEEVDIREVLLQAIGEGKSVGLPVVNQQSGDLKFYRIKGLDNLVYGPWGIKQPDVNAAELMDLKQVDLILVPGLAFDEQGWRLGRGKGYYDRLLKRIKKPTVKLGICFAFQLQKGLPKEPQFDEPVNIVVSS